MNIGLESFITAFISLVAITINTFAVFNYHKLAKILKGSKGWDIFRVGLGFYWASLIAYAVSPDIIGGILADSLLTIGTGIFLYGMLKISSSIREVNS